MPTKPWSPKRRIKMAKKMHGVKEMAAPSGVWKPKSTMQLEGKHAQSVKAHKIGDNVELTIKAKKTSHRMDSDGQHSAGYEVHSVKMNDADELGGPNTKGADNDKYGSNSRQ